jgi:hypothetical protein
MVFSERYRFAAMSAYVAPRASVEDVALTRAEPG